jgi:O-antigen/teichoic acid export membrane protein
MTALLVVLAPSLVQDLLGPRWVGTEAAIQVLAVVTMIEIFGDALTPVFKGMGKPSRIALLAGIQTCILIGLVWELAGKYGLPGAVAAWIPATATAQIVGFFLLRQIIPDAYEGLGKTLLGVSFVGVSGALVSFLIDRTLPGLAGLLMASGAGAGVIMLMLIQADRRLNLGIGTALARAIPNLHPLLARIGLVPGHRTAHRENATHGEHGGR